MQLRFAVRLPVPSERRGRRGHRPRSRAVQTSSGAHQGEEDVSELRGAYQERRGGQDRGALHCNRRSEPCASCDHGARTRAPCRKRGSSVLRQGPARARPEDRRGGEEERQALHDERDDGVPSRMRRDARALRGRCDWQARLHRRRILPLLGTERNPVLQRLAPRTSAAVLSDALERLLHLLDARLLHRSDVHRHHERPSRLQGREESPQQSVRQRSRALQDVRWWRGAHGRDVGRSRLPRRDRAHQRLKGKLRHIYFGLRRA